MHKSTQIPTSKLWSVMRVPSDVHYLNDAFTCLLDKRRISTGSFPLYFVKTSEAFLLSKQIKQKLNILHHLLNLVVRLNVGTDHLRLFRRFFNHSEQII